MIRGLSILLLVAPSVAAADTPSLNADECVAIAVRGSGQIIQAQGQVDEWRGRLKEIEALYMPRFFGLSYLAPMYGVHTAPGTEPGFSPRYTVDLKQWGPYIHFESKLVKPIYSFGQIEEGEKAAGERLAVEEARFEQTRNSVALEVRKYYYLYLYTLSIKPTINQAKKILDDALSQAQDMYESGNGKVTAVDLNKLKYAVSELHKAIVQQKIGEELAMAALKHTMGLADDTPLQLAEQVLPTEPNEPIPDLAALLRVAAEYRPEQAQLRHGRTAALAAENAQRMSNRPLVFIAGEFNFDYAPTRDHDNNPWHYDQYNEVTAGAALGIRFDIDYWGVKARGNTAHAQVEQVEGLERLAHTGIPTEIQKARDDLVQAHELLAVAADGSTAAKKWMMFAGTAYSAGTGEARDVLEGVGSYTQAKKGYYDALLALHQARAELRYAIGDVPITVASAAHVPPKIPQAIPASPATASPPELQGTGAHP